MAWTHPYHPEWRNGDIVRIEPKYGGRAKRWVFFWPEDVLQPKLIEAIRFNTHTNDTRLPNGDRCVKWGVLIRNSQVDLAFFLPRLMGCQTPTEFRNVGWYGNWSSTLWLGELAERVSLVGHTRQFHLVSPPKPKVRRGKRHRMRLLKGEMPWQM